MTTETVQSEGSGTARVLAIIVIIAGIILAVSGLVTWFTVQTQLAAEKITVSDDATMFAGDPVDGPLAAYVEAQVIEQHALEASNGLTYAELDREDPVRQTVMNGSFLRASLFTSVVSFGIAAMSMGLGVCLALIGWALLVLSRRSTVEAVATQPVEA